MKLRSGRQYKSDLSDVLGILAEHEKRENPITMEQIQKAAVNLYGDWKAIPVVSREYVRVVMEQGNFQELYAETLSNERETKARLIQFEQSYSGVLDESNVDAVTESIQRKSDRDSIIKSLLGKQSESAATAQKSRPRTRSDHER